jgi:hypothetical protein
MLQTKKIRNVDVNEGAAVFSDPDFMLAGAVRPSADLAGNIYYVNGDGGSDNFDGLSPDTAYATIDKAIDVSMDRISWSGSPWANNDMIVIFPDVYAENLTSGFYGIVMKGLGWHHDINGQHGVTVKPASGSPLDVTSIINATIRNICFEAPDTSVIFETDNFNRNLVEDCTFQGLPGASPTTTRGFEVVKDMTGSHVRRCEFKQIKSAIYLVADNANSKQITGDKFEDLYITGGDTAGIVFDVNCTPSMSMVNRCNMDGGGSTLALGLDDNSSGELVHCYNTNFEATACDPASGSGHYNNCYLNGTLMT